MRNIRAIVALTVFVVSAISITSCSDDLRNVDNQLFDANNNFHTSKVVNYAALVIDLPKSHVYDFSYTFDEGVDGITVNFFWEDGVTYHTDAEGNETEIIIIGGTTNMFIHNDDLAEIID